MEVNMSKYKIAVLGLRMGHGWARAAHNIPETELTMVYDKYFVENDRIDHDFYRTCGCVIAESEEEVYNSDVDIVVVASPDHIHAEQSIKALKAGKHVICEKPLAPTVADCRQIIDAVKETGKFFMTGQVCRFAPGFRTAKHLIEEGRIGDIVYVESEYAHDYSKAEGYKGWRNDPAIKREGFIGGGCHALDLVRWLVGNPSEVFCYMNHKHLPNWPTNDTGVAVAKFPNDVIGRIFVSIGVKRPYTMRTVINGTRGTIICDNTSDYIQICEEPVYNEAQKLAFAQLPVLVSSHNVDAEVKEFIEYLSRNEQCPTDVFEGTRTVAFGEAAIESAKTGLPVKMNYDFAN
jgi:predicted dehydrogenase